MKTLRFKICGNQENRKGNPIPYFRTTQGSQWSKGAKRYHAWADYVRASYIDAIAGMKTSAERMAYKEIVDFSDKKPIRATDDKMRMTLNIEFANKAHGDCDNIFKGIADALFMNDKHLVGSFDYEYSPYKEGSVYIEITT